MTDEANDDRRRLQRRLVREVMTKIQAARVRVETHTGVRGPLWDVTVLLDTAAQELTLLRQLLEISTGPDGAEHGDDAPP